MRLLSAAVTSIRMRKFVDYFGINGNKRRACSNVGDVIYRRLSSLAYARASLEIAR